MSLTSDDFTRPVHGLIGRLKKEIEGRQYSDIVDDVDNQYVDLVMEGGGVLGIALVGYLYVLEQCGIRFLRVAGTSAGSIAALLLSSLGRSDKPKAERLVKILSDMPIDRFVDGPTESKKFINAIFRILNNVDQVRLSPRRLAQTVAFLYRLVRIRPLLRERLGLNSGEFFEKWARQTLEKGVQGSGIFSLADLLEQMVPPEGLRQIDTNGTKSKIPQDVLAEIVDEPLVLVTSDISTETRVLLPRMADLYWRNAEKTHPSEFVRASMSVPLFFEPVTRPLLHNLEADQRTLTAEARELWRKHAGFSDDQLAEGLPPYAQLVDGGLMSNFPIDVFHNYERQPLCPTFGVKLEIDKRRSNIDSTAPLFGQMLNAMRHILDYEFIRRNPDYNQLVCFIDTGEHFWLDFHLDDEAKIDLFRHGAEAAADFLVRFKWGDYRTDRVKLNTSITEMTERAQSVSSQTRLWEND